MHNVEEGPAKDLENMQHEHLLPLDFTNGYM